MAMNAAPIKLRRSDPQLHGYSKAEIHERVLVEDLVAARSWDEAGRNRHVPPHRGVGGHAQRHAPADRIQPVDAELSDRDDDLETEIFMSLPPRWLRGTASTDRR
jgi:hypothetical protein